MKYLLLISVFMFSSFVWADGISGNWSRTSSKYCDKDAVRISGVFWSVTGCKISFTIEKNSLCNNGKIVYTSRGGSKTYRLSCKLFKDNRLNLYTGTRYRLDYLNEFSGNIKGTETYKGDEILVVERGRNLRDVWFWKQN